MPRAPVPPLDRRAADGDGTGLQPQQNQTGQHGRSVVPDTIGRPVDPDTRVEIIRGHYTQAAISLFEACRHLAILREETPDGEWMKRLDQIGISERTARRHVQMGKRLLRSEGVAGLLPDKVRAVLDLGEDDFREIEEEGALDRVPLDKYASMSRRRLEDLARQKERQLAQGKEQYRKAQDRIEELEAEAAGAPRGALDQALLRASVSLTQIGVFFGDEVRDLTDAEAERVREEKGWAIYAALMAKMDELRPVIVDKERLTT